MSFQTTAILFYGFPIPQKSERAENDRDSVVRQDYFGSDGDLTHYIAATSGEYRADLDTGLRLASLNVDPEWHRSLRAFCKRNEIAWPDNGPAWHIAPVRV